MTESSTNPRVLMVDDEPNILDGYRRSMRGRFTVVTANSGPAGLELIAQSMDEGRPFLVIVSDMKMPGMDGAQFLGQARVLDPDAVQMLLSGQADLDSTIAAVNNGNLFRFLTKPCDTPDLELALGRALEQHRLVRAERDLLERTLGGAVDVLTELLSMASPEAFTGTERVRTLVSGMSRDLGVDDWRLPLAAMLSQIGCVAVPDDVLHRARTGGQLSDDELQVYRAHPQTAQRLLERIPRLDDVARWVGDQPVGANAAPPDPQAETPTLLLHVVLAYLGALDTLGNPARALRQLTAAGHYPQELLDALDASATALAPQGVLRALTVEQIRAGMLLDADVETTTGMPLIRKGERITQALAMRLANFSRTVGVKQPIMILDGV